MIISYILYIFLLSGIVGSIFGLTEVLIAEYKLLNNNRDADLWERIIKYIIVIPIGILGGFWAGIYFLLSLPRLIYRFRRRILID